MGINKINGINAADLAKLAGISISDISKVNGVALDAGVSVPTISAYGSAGSQSQINSSTMVGSTSLVSVELSKGRWIVIYADGTNRRIFGLSYDGSTFTKSSTEIADSAGFGNGSWCIISGMAFILDNGSGSWGLYSYSGGTAAVVEEDTGTLSQAYTGDGGEYDVYPLYQSAADVWVIIYCYKYDNSGTPTPVYQAIEVDVSTPSTTTVTELDAYAYTGIGSPGTQNPRLAYFGKVSGAHYFAGFYTNRPTIANRGQLYHVSISFSESSEVFTLEKAETLLDSHNYNNLACNGNGNHYDPEIITGVSTFSVKVNAESTLEAVIVYRRGGSGIASNTDTRALYYSMNSSTGALTLEDSDTTGWVYDTDVILSLYKNGSSISDTQYILTMPDEDASGSYEWETYQGYLNVDTGAKTVEVNGNVSWNNIDGGTYIMAHNGSFSYSYDWDTLICLWAENAATPKVNRHIASITNS